MLPRGLKRKHLACLHRAKRETVVSLTLELTFK